jgi:hypothetical protein
LVFEHIVVGYLLAVEYVQYTQTASNLDNFVHLHTQIFGKFDFFHQLDEVLGIGVFSDLKFHAETVNQQLYQRLVFDLEFKAFVGDFLDEDLEFDSGAVLGVDELSNSIVEFIRISVEVDV